MFASYICCQFSIFAIKIWIFSTVSFCLSLKSFLKSICFLSKALISLLNKSLTYLWIAPFLSEPPWPPIASQTCLESSSRSEEWSTMTLYVIFPNLSYKSKTLYYVGTNNDSIYFESLSSISFIFTRYWVKSVNYNFFSTILSLDSYFSKYKVLSFTFSKHLFSP